MPKRDTKRSLPRTASAARPASSKHDRPMMEPLALRREEAARVIGVGMTKLKELIRENRLREVRAGSASLIPLSSIREFIGDVAP